VQSRDKDVDPVGACVGMKGMRVQSIIRELRGEKIDIIPYSEDTVQFAQKALSPAKVTRVQIIDPETRHLEVIVEDTQLSLAIGKKGQNVRLASKLIGWNVDIKSEEEKRQEIEAQMTALTAPGTPLSELKGVGPKTIERIETHGVTTIEKLADMTPEQLTEIPGIGEKVVDKIQLSVAAYFQSLENPQPESESVEAIGDEEEDAAAVAEQSDQAEEAVEGADVQAEEIDAPSEAEEIADAAAAHGDAGTRTGGAEPEASAEDSEEGHGNK
jgi:transcription termination/antitermination protein NusA